ncbi:DUF6414 family protein [Methanofollis ethanolicus]|uniref:DUF6414 family protein n=1 Tax=Methanofollis ethanolicus TaxID=488124 RepID=UPI00128EA51F|nr:hypothetical protein [Methanofollis ethanolicus]
MDDQGKIKIPTDLCVPIYLNQQVVFDLLAIIEGGFSVVSTINQSYSQNESQNSDIGASLGTQLLQFFNISVGGSKSIESGQKEQKEISKQKVHTPTSLFSNLRTELKEKGLIKSIATPDDIANLSSGDFIEYKAILKKNPLIDTIEMIKQLLEIAVLFNAEKSIGKTQNKPAKGNQRKDQNPNEKFLEQIDGLLKSLTQSESVEIIGDILGSENIKSVLSTKLGYFNDQNADEIIDGEYYVLGKIVRIVKTDSEEPINLLRKTTFGRFDNHIFEKFPSMLSQAEEGGLKTPEFVTEIRGPAIQVMPIAIFI